MVALNLVKVIKSVKHHNSGNIEQYIAASESLVGIEDLLFGKV